MKKSLFVLSMWLAMVLVAIEGCTSGPWPLPTVSPTITPTELPKLTLLPENPCDILTSEIVSAVAGVQVTQEHRVPSIDELVEAQRENHSPPPGSICSYNTNSKFGAIEVALPLPSERTSATYWERRNTYFQEFPGSAEAIPGLGEDAWLGGGASLSVLVRSDVWLVLSTQMYQSNSKDLLIRLASAVLERF